MFKHPITSIITSLTNLDATEKAVLDFPSQICWSFNAWTLRNSLKIWNGKSFLQKWICHCMIEIYEMSPFQWGPPRWSKHKIKWFTSFCIQCWVPFSKTWKFLEFQQRIKLVLQSIREVTKENSPQIQKNTVLLFTRYDR